MLVCQPQRGRIIAAGVTATDAALWGSGGGGGRGGASNQPPTTSDPPCYVVENVHDKFTDEFSVT